ncbi:MAG TPA: argininosuccinate lyase [Candidatus Saccharimonadia bacterium]|jgi:argininosuccinate lyase|nr:argininosuccinate lyase [Candidatus Saccharimonadia bacterium]
MQTKLWQTSAGTLHPLVEQYTVGQDHLLDQQLLGYDIAASIAHAGMLQAIGVLTAAEQSALTQALNDLLAVWRKGGFTIQPSQEDGHTAIEQYLVEKLGDTGKKIHTGRSRNDQSLVMMRLYLKDQLKEVAALTASASKAFKTAAGGAGHTPMPGYTHLQKAMPTTVAMWLGSYADALADVPALLKATLALIDQNPLGSAAGFGVSLPLDRDHTTAALGFKKTQANPMYCGLSRGLFELMAVQALNPVMVLAGKFAHDMLMFTTEEFGFFSLPPAFTTGSSIMPHKQNYDLFEVMRGLAHGFGAHAMQLQAIAAGIGSGYQRDLQLSKGVTLAAFNEAVLTLKLLAEAVSALQMHPANLKAAITPDMHSVAEINKLVDRGVPFRDAYAQVKQHLASAGAAQ